MTEATLFQLGEFTLAAGQKTAWKIECDALTSRDWDALAWMLVERLPEPFGEVVGVPRGGEPLAEALRRYQDVDSDRVLIVDDVWTTGRSMQRFINDTQQLTTRKLTRAVVFARNPAPRDVIALFSMNQQGA